MDNIIVDDLTENLNLTEENLAGLQLNVDKYQPKFRKRECSLKEMRKASVKDTPTISEQTINKKQKKIDDDKPKKSFKHKSKHKFMNKQNKHNSAFSCPVTTYENESLINRAKILEGLKNREEHNKPIQLSDLNKYNKKTDFDYCTDNKNQPNSDQNMDIAENSNYEEPGSDTLILQDDIKKDAELINSIKLKQKLIKDSENLNTKNKNLRKMKIWLETFSNSSHQTDEEEEFRRQKIEYEKRKKKQEMQKKLGKSKPSSKNKKSRQNEARKRQKKTGLTKKKDKQVTKKSHYGSINKRKSMMKELLGSKIKAK